MSLSISLCHFNINSRRNARAERARKAADHAVGPSGGFRRMGPQRDHDEITVLRVISSGEYLIARALGGVTHMSLAPTDQPRITHGDPSCNAREHPGVQGGFLTAPF
jgi:hypothetical protein